MAANTNYLHKWLSAGYFFYNEWINRLIYEIIDCKKIKIKIRLSTASFVRLTVQHTKTSFYIINDKEKHHIFIIKMLEPEMIWCFLLEKWLNIY